MVGNCLGWLERENCVYQIVFKFTLFCVFHGNSTDYLEGHKYLVGSLAGVILPIIFRFRL